MLPAQHPMPRLNFPSPIHRLCLALACAAILSGVETQATAADAPKNPDSRDRSTAVALNYCRASFHRIRKNPSKRVMLEEQEKLSLQQQRVVIARRRLEISQLLRDKGQGNEAQLEQVRDQFFSAQENLFRNQETYIGRQAQLRRLMGYLK